jgi:transcriptional regulator with XRE-family HTH domain
MGRQRVTQMQLRDVLGVSQTGISKRLRGLTPFDANEIGLLAEFFGVKPSELVDGTGPSGGGGGSMGAGRHTPRYAHQRAA